MRVDRATIPITVPLIQAFQDAIGCSLKPSNQGESMNVTATTPLSQLMASSSVRCSRVFMDGTPRKLSTGRSRSVGASRGITFDPHNSCADGSRFLRCSAVNNTPFLPRAPAELNGITDPARCHCRVKVLPYDLTLAERPRLAQEHVGAGAPDTVAIKTGPAFL